MLYLSSSLLPSIQANVSNSEAPRSLFAKAFARNAAAGGKESESGKVGGGLGRDEGVAAPATAELAAVEGKENE